MKISRIIIGLITGFFALCLSARPMTEDQPSERRAKTLWVVDGVALNDSVFDYTLDQMRSDSAAVLAVSSLYFINRNNISEITVIDSIEAADYGFVNCNGVVKITTSYRESLPIIINGNFYKSKSKVSAGDALGGQEYIKHIIMTEFADLDEYGVSDFRIIKKIGNIGCRTPRTPLVVVITELPYYRIESLVGNYVGKSGKYVYMLKLNADSTYEFTKKDTRKMASVPQILKLGTCNISRGNIFLTCTQDSAANLRMSIAAQDTIYLTIKRLRTLTLPKNVWGNKKSVTLKRQ
ncbi:MAG: hypothetical protein K2N28_02505 [Muribaculaceae bacterium]|nr:hypothetical protein [Muribaculaceae bacterium]